MILTTTAFIDLYNIQLPEEKVQNAIQTATEYFYNLISARQEWKIQDLDDNRILQLVNWYPLSKDLSIELKAEDVYLYEYDQDWNTYDLNDKIDTINFVEIQNNNVLKITFTEDLPTTSDRVLILRINKSRLNSFSQEKIDNVRRFLALKTFNMLSKDIIISLNQNGITDWNLNGVSVRADNDGINMLRDNNELEMRQLFDVIMPIAIERTRVKQEWLGGRFEQI